MSLSPSPSKPPYYVTERDFQEMVTDLARYCHWWVYHPHDSRHSQAGWPDLALARPPHFLLVELKTERGVVSRAQAETMCLLAACGLDCRLWRPSDWPEIEATLIGSGR